MDVTCITRPAPCLRRFTVPFHVSFLQIICRQIPARFHWATMNQLSKQSPTFVTVFNTRCLPSQFSLLILRCYTWKLLLIKSLMEYNDIKRNPFEIVQPFVTFSNSRNFNTYRKTKSRRNKLSSNRRISLKNNLILGNIKHTISNNVSRGLASL